MTGSTGTYLKRANNLVNTLKPTEWYTLKWRILWYVNYMSIKNMEYKILRRSASCLILYLGSNTPVKPPNVRRMPEPSVHSTCHQSMGFGFFILHHVVEIGTSGKHGRFPQTLSKDHHQQAGGTEPGDLLQFCRGHGDKWEVKTLGCRFPPLDAEN